MAALIFTLILFRNVQEPEKLQILIYSQRAKTFIHRENPKEGRIRSRFQSFEGNLLE